MGGFFLEALMGRQGVHFQPGSAGTGMLAIGHAAILLPGHRQPFSEVTGTPWDFLLPALLRGVYC